MKYCPFLKKSYFQNQLGFSFVEIILVVVIAVLIAVMLTNLPNSLELIGLSKRESLSKDIISKTIEDLRSKGYENICDPAGSSCIENVVDPRITSLPYGDAQAVVEGCPPGICSSNELIKKITVSITWIEKGVVKKSEAFTLISKGGLK